MHVLDRLSTVFAPSKDGIKRQWRGYGGKVKKASSSGAVGHYRNARPTAGA
jgi:hypothetical protein